MLLNIKDAYTDKVVLNRIIYVDKIKGTNPVKEVNEELYRQCKEVLKACVAYNGIGLAANQIGIQKSFFILKETEETYRIYINPKYKAIGSNVLNEKEACLSVPSTVLMVSRPETIKANWYEIFGEELVLVENTLTGMDARCFIHETDHLSSISMIDRARDLNRDQKRDLKKRISQRGW